MYKAILEIGGYAIGDVVPDDKAKLWLMMYLVPQVELVKDDATEPETKEDVAEPEKAQTDAELMLDDYLARSKNVVVAAINNDKLNGDTLTTLLKMEKEGKNRTKVITAIENSMKREVE